MANPRKRPSPGSSPPMQQTSILDLASAFGFLPGSVAASENQVVTPSWDQAALPHHVTSSSSSYPDPIAHSGPNSYDAFGGSVVQTSTDPDAQHILQQQQQQQHQQQRQQQRLTPVDLFPHNQQLVRLGQQAIVEPEDTWADYGEGLQLDGAADNGLMADTPNVNNNNNSNNNNNNDGANDDDDIEQLERRAVIAKREVQAKRKQIPPFVQKLSSFLDEDRNTDLIRWSDNGRSFIVLDEDEFAKRLIPELFKHSNYASFVRQLNMYGFHKKVGLSDNSMRASERRNKSPSEYANRFFIRGHPNLLWLINKPKNSNVPPRGSKDGGRTNETATTDRDGSIGPVDGGTGVVNDPTPNVLPPAPSMVTSGQDLAELRRQLQQVTEQQRIISDAIARLGREHSQIYQQADAFRVQHDRHENSINAILTFLATVYNRSLDGHGGQSIANVLAHTLPPEARNVGDLGLAPTNDENLAASTVFYRQRLLMAPPDKSDRGTPREVVSVTSPTVSTSTPPAGGVGAERYVARESRRVRPPSSQPPPQPRRRRPSDDDLGLASPSVNLDQPDFSGLVGDNDLSGSPDPDLWALINNASVVGTRNQGTSTFVDLPYQTITGNSTEMTPASPPTRPQHGQNLQMLVTTPIPSSGSNNSTLNTTNTTTTNPVLMASNHRHQHGGSSIPLEMDVDTDHLRKIQQHLDLLHRLQADQETKVQDLAEMIQPLSPLGSIPGLNHHHENDNNGGGGGAGGGAPGGGHGSGNGQLDLDQFFDNDYFATTATANAATTAPRDLDDAGSNSSVSGNSSVVDGDGGGGVFDNSSQSPRFEQSLMADGDGGHGGGRASPTTVLDGGTNPTAATTATTRFLQRERPLRRQRYHQPPGDDVVDGDHSADHGGNSNQDHHHHHHHHLHDGGGGGGGGGIQADDSRNMSPLKRQRIH